MKVYKLATVKERREHLKKLKLCFCCGLSFHGIPWKSGGRNTPCNWDRKLDPVKCQGNSCEKGAATCLEHAKESNATEELKTWLDKNNIASTLVTIFSLTSCKVEAKPLPTKVSKKVRNKTKDDDTKVSKKVRNKTKDVDDLQITVDQLMAKIKDLTSDNKGYVDKTHYLEERIADLEVEIKETNNLNQARIKARDK